MFNFIVDVLKTDNHFKGKGIYLENRANHWISIIPSRNDEDVTIQWKNGGFKKRGEKVSSETDLSELFEEWKEEISKNGTENGILKIFENDKRFKEKIILGQKEFRKNTRSFEISLEEKLKESNENYGYGNQTFISYITLYFFLKQFRMKIKTETFNITNPLRQEIVLFKRDGKITPIRTPLEFKLVLEDALSKREKQCLKREFVSKAREYLTPHTDLQYTGINRLLEKFKI